MRVSKPHFLGGTEEVAWQYTEYSYANTRGNIEDVRWSSIKLAASLGVGAELISARNPRLHSTAASLASLDLAAYIKQGVEFYRSSKNASDSTSPLYLYYSFLNLCKAVVEINRPGLTTRPSHRKHGLSRESNGLNLDDELIKVYSEGVFQELVSSRIGKTWSPPPFALSMRSLLGCSREISSEYQALFGNNPSTVIGIEPVVSHQAGKFCLRIKIPQGGSLSMSDVSAMRKELAKTDMKWKYLGLLSGGTLHSSGAYAMTNLHTFESKSTWAFASESDLRRRSSKLVGRLGLNYTIKRDDFGLIREDFTYVSQDALQAPIRFSCLEINFLILFWFGSLVRYDPARLEELINHRSWFLLEGFLRQALPTCVEEVDWAIHDRTSILVPMI